MKELVSYLYAQCRTNSINGGDVSQTVLNQLFLTVKKLCETGNTFSSQVGELSS